MRFVIDISYEELIALHWILSGELLISEPVSYAVLASRIEGVRKQTALLIEKTEIENGN